MAGGESASRRSVDPDERFFDRARPLCRLNFHEGAEFFERTDDRIGVLRDEFFPYVEHAKNPDDFAVQTVDDVTRCCYGPYTPQMRSALENDRFAQIKQTYEKYGDGRSNLRYGYVTKPLA